MSREPTYRCAHNSTNRGEITPLTHVFLTIGAPCHSIYYDRLRQPKFVGLVLRFISTTGLPFFWVSPLDPAPRIPQSHSPTTTSRCCCTTRVSGLLVGQPSRFFWGTGKSPTFLHSSSWWLNQTNPLGKNMTSSKMGEHLPQGF